MAVSSPTRRRSVDGLLFACQVSRSVHVSCSGRRSAVPWGRQRRRRADRAPGRCRAGGGLLGGKDPPAAWFIRPSRLLLLQLQDFLRLRPEAAQFFRTYLVFFQRLLVLFQ